MKIIQRIGYYLGGFSIGLVVLAFFLSGKKTSCSYGPDARVLKNINLKTLNYNQNVLKLLENKSIDTASIKFILRKGDVNFSQSNPRVKPCGIYIVEGKYNDNELALQIENCDDVATLLDVKIID